MTMISTSNVMQVKVAEHQVQHKCPCLACRQDRVREWVGRLLDAGIPAVAPTFDPVVEELQVLYKMFPNEDLANLLSSVQYGGL